MNSSVRFHFDDKMSKVAVRKSCVHNRGLFALEACKRGDELCYYGGRLQTRAQLRRQRPRSSTYDIYWDSYYTLVGYKEPTPRYPERVAQFANDGAAILTCPPIKELRETRAQSAFVRSLTQAPEFFEIVSNYYLVTKNNTRFTSCFDKKGKKKRITLTATRDIDAGEELFVSYGASYWIGRIGNTDQQDLMDIAEACLKILVEWLFPNNEPLDLSDKIENLDSNARAQLILAIETHKTKIVGDYLVIENGKNTERVCNVRTRRIV